MDKPLFLLSLPSTPKTPFQLLVFSVSPGDISSTQGEAAREEKHVELCVQLPLS